LAQAAPGEQLARGARRFVEDVLNASQIVSRHYGYPGEAPERIERGLEMLQRLPGANPTGI
jgi:hypothetical protein